LRLEHTAKQGEKQHLWSGGGEVPLCALDVFVVVLDAAQVVSPAPVATRGRTAASEAVVPLARTASLPHPSQRPASETRRASPTPRPAVACRGWSAPPAGALGFEWGLERRVGEGTLQCQIDLLLEG
jgi:hypothetical protein